MIDRRAEYKWRFAIGTTSRVPSSDLHYLIGDVDGQILPVLKKLYEFCFPVPNNIFVQKTQHGYHFYTDLKIPFSKAIFLLHKIGCDKAWIEIAKTRGYFFLADKSAVILPWPVERMKIQCRNTQHPRNLTSSSTDTLSKKKPMPLSGRDGGAQMIDRRRI